MRRRWPAWWKRLLDLWAARRRSRPALLSVIGRLELGAKKSLVIVACGERRFLVANSPEAISAMLEIDGRRGRTAAAGGSVKRRRSGSRAPGRRAEASRTAGDRQIELPTGLRGKL